MTNEPSAAAEPRIYGFLKRIDSVGALPENQKIPTNKLIAREPEKLNSGLKPLPVGLENLFRFTDQTNFREGRKVEFAQSVGNDPGAFV